ncbi:hypothetical protein [Mucilaginibacter lacusdianchii]|uniref:hypothetical protein n=1 Tax=Mucilaginibacter lacusdianchii TaxID=2684211 RepID=UPI00131D7671|nr:hypothetical protein [Mucilaginibacter sp. JXJ CY 39]
MVIYLLRLLIAAGARYFCHSHKSIQKGLAVAITSPPARPSLARAQQRAFALLFIFFLDPYSTKALSEQDLKKESAFSFFRQLLT